MTQAVQMFDAPAEDEGVSNPFPHPIAPPSVVRSRRLRLYAATGILAYCFALLATLPAGLLLRRAGEPSIWLAHSGTVWAGEAALAHGHAIRWNWAPVASLVNLAYVTDLEVMGVDADLKGRAAWNRSAVVLTDLDGTASATLLTALAPRLPFVCDLPMRVNIRRIAFGGSQPGASGEIRSGAGSCTSRGSLLGESTAVPPLVAEATSNLAGSSGWVALRGSASERLISFHVTPNGELSVTVAPAASALIPGVDAISKSSR